MPDGGRLDVVTYGHNLSDFVSFLLFWRSGCQTLPWCQSRKCCEHYCDPVDCSDWRSGKKIIFLPRPLVCFTVFFMNFTYFEPSMQCYCSFSVFTFTCSECITDTLGVSELQYFMWLPWLKGREKGGYSPYGHHFRWKMCSGIFPQGASIEDFYMHCCTYVWWEKQSVFLASVFFWRGHSGSLCSIRSKKLVFM